MVRKNKKSKNGNPNSNNAPATSIQAVSTSSQPSGPSTSQPATKLKDSSLQPNNVSCGPRAATNKPAHSKESNKPTSTASSLSTNQKKQPNQSNNQKGTIQKAKGVVNTKANTQKSQKGKAGRGEVLQKKAKASLPRAGPRPLKDKINIKIPRTTHAPPEYRLKCSILFKQECAMYSSEIIQAPVVDYFFKYSRDDDPPDLDIFKAVDQLVAQDKANEILTTVTSVLDSNNPVLINYDSVLTILAKCLHVVRQDPKAKLPSPTIIEFRSKVLALAVDRVSAASSERLLQFVHCLCGFSRKILQSNAVRLALAKWYTDKEADQLVSLVARCSFYHGLGHAFLLKMIHFDLVHQSADKQLALCAVAFGFGNVAQRLITGSFPPKLFIPKYVQSLECFNKADEKVKTAIKDVAMVRCPTSFQKLVAAAVRAYNLTIGDVSSTFCKSYKVNAACLDQMTQRELLQSMHRLRMNNILSSSDQAKVDDVTTCDLYVKQLEAATVAEPPLHPAEVLEAYVEYVLAPRVKMAKVAGHRGRDQPCTDGAAAGGGDGASGKESQELPPVKSARTPEPAISSALQDLYTKSFKNLKTHSLKIMVCLDLQSVFETSHCQNYEPLLASHLSMLLLQSLLHMVETRADLRVVSFRESKTKPVIRLKLPPPADKPDDANPVEAASELEQLTDVGVASDEEDEDMEVSADPASDIVDELQNTWKFYKKQVPRARGITYHKLLSWASKQQKHWQPDTFVVICHQDKLSLFRANRAFSEYMETTKKKNAKLITVSPCSHLKSCRLVHRKNMLHIVGFDPNLTHIITEFLDSKI